MAEGFIDIWRVRVEARPYYHNRVRKLKVNVHPDAAVPARFNRGDGNSRLAIDTCKGSIRTRKGNNNTNQHHALLATLRIRDDDLRAIPVGAKAPDNLEIETHSAIRVSARPSNRLAVLIKP